MDYSIKDLYARTIKALKVDYDKVFQTAMAYSDFYHVGIERTPNFTILLNGLDNMALIALYDWYNHIALDLSANADGFTNGEIKHIIESFFWFADEVISVPQEVLSCQE